MQDHERILQIIGTLFLLAFSVLQLAVRYIKQIQGAWKDTLLLAALFTLVSVMVRTFVLLDHISQSDARTLNGLIASVFVAAEIVVILSQIAADQRCRRDNLLTKTPVR